MLPEQDAFIEKLYHEFFTQLWIYTKAALGDPEQTQEVVQDTFHEAVRHIDILMAHDNPKGWLMDALKKKIMHARRSMNRYILRFISLDSDLEFTDPVLSVEDPAPNNVQDTLREIRRVLSEEEWDLLRKITLEKQPYKNVAEELGITVWTCQKRIERMRKKLKQYFAENS